MLGLMLPVPPAASPLREICTPAGLMRLPGDRGPGDRGPGGAAKDCVKCHVLAAGLPAAPRIGAPAGRARAAAPSRRTALHAPQAPAPGPARGPPGPA
ncbi:MAG: hypothetical protein D6686_14905 [Alphaproteobacteria bacterium]|nr:MAG: hypothetical protein D6686_14905 [Alphaproteobacteria bacterium]